MNKSGPDQDLCNHCRDFIDCHCQGGCDDLGKCPHGCYLSKYTKPLDTCDFLDRVPQKERDILTELKSLLGRFTTRIDQALGEVPAREDLFTTEDADLLQAFYYDGMCFEREHVQQLLEFLVPHLPENDHARLQKLVSDYNSSTEVLDRFWGGLVVGNNRTRDGKKQWTEIRIILPTGIPDENL